MLERRRHHRADGVFTKLVRPGGVERATVHTDAYGAVVLAGNVREIGHFLTRGLVALVVVEVAGIVTDLVHVGRHLLRESIALLQIHGKVRLGSPPDGLDGIGFFLTVDGNAHDTGAGPAELLRLQPGRVDVLGLRRAHALHHDGVAFSDCHATDGDAPRRVPLYGHRPHCSLVIQAEARATPVVPPISGFTSNLQSA